RFLDFLDHRGLHEMTGGMQHVSCTIFLLYAACSRVCRVAQLKSTTVRSIGSRVFLEGKRDGDRQECETQHIAPGEVSCSTSSPVPPASLANGSSGSCWSERARWCTSLSGRKAKARWPAFASTGASRAALPPAPYRSSATSPPGGWA